MIDPNKYPDLARIASAVVEVWPEHVRFLEQSFASRAEDLLVASERHSEIILRLANNRAALTRYCNDYRFLCEKLLEEEIYFRRNDCYRLSRFEDAHAEVYSNREFMSRYMNFLLLSHVLWDNHARAIRHFEDEYLPMLPKGTDHLEIGPGHGLLLHLACHSPMISSVTGWDVSETSIAQARHCLDTFGDSMRVDLINRNLFDSVSADENEKQFGSVVLAEILEHLEDPAAALKAASRLMRPGGFVWIHVPINSPAPDHIYLLRTPEEAIDLVRNAGFEIVDSAFFPMTGQTLDRARKHKLTISAAITARFPL